MGRQRMKTARIRVDVQTPALDSTAATSLFSCQYAAREPRKASALMTGSPCRQTLSPTISAGLRSAGPVELHAWKKAESVRRGDRRDETADQHGHSVARVRWFAVHLDESLGRFLP